MKIYGLITAILLPSAAPTKADDTLRYRISALECQGVGVWALVNTFNTGEITLVVGSDESIRVESIAVTSFQNTLRRSYRSNSQMDDVWQLDAEIPIGADRGPGTLVFWQREAIKELWSELCCELFGED